MAQSAAREFTPEEAASIAAAIGLDFTVEGIDPAEFRRGLAVEMEHGTRDPRTNVTGDDPIATGKIAWAHLQEMPDYYTRLAVMEGD
jgi:hypothetical protein